MATIFDDGFNDVGGPPGSWSGTDVYGGDSVSYVTTDPQEGARHLRAQSSGDGTSAAAVYKDSLNEAIVYAGMWIKFNTNLPGTDEYCGLIRFTNSSWVELCTVAIRDVGGTFKQVRMDCWYGSQMNYSDYSTFEYALDTWYWLEIWANINASGSYGVRIDDTEYVNTGTVDSTGRNNVGLIFAGIPYSTSTNALDVYADDFKSADTGPIGAPEYAGAGKLVSFPSTQALQAAGML